MKRVSTSLSLVALLIGYCVGSIAMEDQSGPTMHGDDIVPPCKPFPRCLLPVIGGGDGDDDGSGEGDGEGDGDGDDGQPPDLPPA